MNRIGTRFFSKRRVCLPKAGQVSWKDQKPLNLPGRCIIATSSCIIAIYTYIIVKEEDQIKGCCHIYICMHAYIYKGCVYMYLWTTSCHYMDICDHGACTACMMCILVVLLACMGYLEVRRKVAPSLQNHIYRANGF